MRCTWTCVAVMMWLGALALDVKADETPLNLMPADMRISTGEPTGGIAFIAFEDTSETPAPSTDNEDPFAPVKANLQADSSAVVSKESSKESSDLDALQVIRINHTPVESVFSTIRETFDLEIQQGTLRITKNTVSNSLVVLGEPKMMEFVRKLVDELDQPPVRIRLDIVIGDMPIEAAATGEAQAEGEASAEAEGSAKVMDATKAEEETPQVAKESKDESKGEAEQPADDATDDAEPSPEEICKQMTVVAKVQLMSINNQAAFARIQRGSPLIPGLVPINPQGESTTPSLPKAGIEIGFTPQIGSDGIVTMELDIDDFQYIAPEDEQVNTPIPLYGQFSLQSTLSMRDGQTVVVGSIAQPPKSDKRRVILVTAHILPMD